MSSSSERYPDLDREKLLEEQVAALKELVAAYEKQVKDLQSRLIMTEQAGEDIRKKNERLLDRAKSAEALSEQRMHEIEELKGRWLALIGTTP